MCDPLTIASIALTAGSTVANSIANNKVQKARNDTMAAERVRQHGYEQQAQALNTRSQDRYQNFNGQEDQKASELGKYFTDQHIADGANNAAITEQMTAPQSGSDIVVNEENKQRAKAQQFTDQQGNALGELRSFGDLLGGIGRGQARDAGEIGQIGGFMRGSSSVLPYELEAANSAGDGAKMIGDILGLAGSVGLNAGLSGGKIGSGITNFATHTTFPAAPGMAAGTMAARAPSNLYSLYGNSAGLF